MLEKLKSFYFIKFLFFHLSEGKKLKLAKYSKNLQKILDRRHIHYKIYSKRYIIYCQDGKGKEYDGLNNKLIFEGEYLNGKRNGKGEEYHNNGALLFEGKYLNGKRNGKGREYNNFGDLIFEVEYLNGERNGKGKEFNEEGELIFEGEYLTNNRIKIEKYSNGLRNGKGKEYNK